MFEPRASIGTTAEWLVKLRAAVGRRAALGIDYHHRLSVGEAASFCQAMPTGTLDFLEEPIRDESPEAYQALQRMTPVPMAIGEEFASKWQFLPYVERGIPAYARLDICNVGGFTEAMKVVGWCEAHYIDLMPHNPLGPISTAANIHLAAATPLYAWLEERSPEPGFHFDPELFPVQPMLEGVFHRVPDTPGLGRGVQRGSARGAEGVRVLGEPAPAPARRLAHQLVTPVPRPAMSRYGEQAVAPSPVDRMMADVAAEVRPTPLFRSS